MRSCGDLWRKPRKAVPCLFLARNAENCVAVKEVQSMSLQMETLEKTLTLEKKHCTLSSPPGFHNSHNTKNELKRLRVPSSCTNGFVDLSENIHGRQGFMALRDRKQLACTGTANVSTSNLRHTSNFVFEWLVDPQFSMESFGSLCCQKLSCDLQSESRTGSKTRKQMRKLQISPSEHLLLGSSFRKCSSALQTGESSPGCCSGSLWSITHKPRF